MIAQRLAKAVHRRKHLYFQTESNALLFCIFSPTTSSADLLSFLTDLKKSLLILLNSFVFSGIGTPTVQLNIPTVLSVKIF